MMIIGVNIAAIADLIIDQVAGQIGEMKMRDRLCRNQK